MTSAPQDVQATFCATLVDEWVRHGLRHAVVAPGSRSTPMALALAARPDIDVHIFHDERSASFASLGIALATGVPAALLCTSGTAATHFHAAVVEAHQSGVPMVVLTADRPPELHGVGAPQTIEQTNLYGVAVRSFVDPGVAEDDQRGTWRSIASAAWRTATGDRPGPVHLNLPFREPLVGQAGELPPVEPMELISPPLIVIDELVALLTTPHGLIVAGNGVDESRSVEALADATGWPVLADPLSGCQQLESAVVRFDALLRHTGFAADHYPAVVLQLGMPPASKVLAQWLAASGASHVAVSPAGLVSDPNLLDAQQYQGQRADTADQRVRPQNR